MYFAAYEILKNGDLKFTLVAGGKEYLQEMKQDNPEKFGTDDMMYDLFENLTTNDSFQWCKPEWAGALTSAPMLAWFDGEKPLPEELDSQYVNVVGRWTDPEDGRIKTFYQPIDKCWAFMDYAVTSPQEALLNQGFCVWTAGENDKDDEQG